MRHKRLIKANHPELTLPFNNIHFIRCTNAYQHKTTHFVVGKNDSPTSFRINKPSTHLSLLETGTHMVGHIAQIFHVLSYKDVGIPKNVSMYDS
jgi:hypothetical protein